MGTLFSQNTQTATHLQKASWKLHDDMHKHSASVSSSSADTSHATSDNYKQLALLPKGDIEMNQPGYL